MILDGWGHGRLDHSNAIFQAHTPFIDSLYDTVPNGELRTDGKYVGLPDGQMGNSEVGHLTIGAGRVVYQNLAKINNACEKNTLKDRPYLKASFQYAIENNKPLHIMGLLSDGGIHSHCQHLYEICRLAKIEGVKSVFVHAFTDGRDTNPNDGIGFIKTLEENLHGAKIASICGRYYAMDRDQRWERIKVAYDLLVHAKGTHSSNLIESIQASYDEGITDEFILPIVASQNGQPIATIQNGDAVICFNFRTDRCRQITTVLTQNHMPSFEMHPLKVHYTTMTEYDKRFKNVSVLFENESLQNTLGQVISKHGLTQLRIAETEKYPHVTFFFSGGEESTLKGEKRLMIDSPKVATYDDQPEMSAPEIVKTIIPELTQQTAHFMCLNFANPDMVGHTGNLKAIIKAVETVDQCVKEVTEAATQGGYAVLIIADHGNADCVINSDGSPHTAHTNNPVPCFLLNTSYSSIKDGTLGDIAPTILTLLGLNIPKEMTGKILI